MIAASLARQLEQALGAQLGDLQSLSGGDINDAYAVQLSDGRSVFVKTNRSANPRMFSCEARGLAWLAEADTVRVPRVLAASDPEADGPHFLALELLQPAARVADFDEQLGRGLAGLHRFGAPRFGLDYTNFIATLEQPNQAEPDTNWPEFYVSRRLQPLLRHASGKGLISRELLATFDRLFERMADLVGADEPPARLHGDLWGGNLHTDDRGQPCLIDPAVYGGHREIDLAMMRLFGGFGSRVFAAYHEAYPLAAGHEDRVQLYQLFPLLVHVNLFGGGYVSSLRDAARRYVG